LFAIVPNGHAPFFIVVLFIQRFAYAPAAALFLLHRIKVKRNTHFYSVKSISSIQNPLIRQVLDLQSTSRERNKLGLFVIDGWKETQMALDNGYEINTIFFKEGFDDHLAVKNMEQAERIEVSEKVFEKIAYRGNTSKVVAIAQAKNHPLEALKISGQPLLLVLDAVEKPGNLGAMLRTADAAGIDGVIVCDPATDIYNPNVIRSSVGCVFSVPVAVASRETCLKFLKEQQISTFTTSLKAAENYLKPDYRKATAFVLGTEATGVDPVWEKESDQNIIIPMRGQNDSLNVSNAAAILLFEALRQRG
jgi:TrmH family RNA methyltransferase